MKVENSIKHERVIYLVQHGEAKPKEVDSARPLSEKGRKEVETVANWAEKAGLIVDKIRHSGKLRAEETAFIFAKKLQVENKVITASGLAPMDDVEPVAKALGQETQSLMLVGHLPFMNRLASRLLTNNPEQTVVRFRQGGLVGLVEEAGKWSVALLVLPPEKAQR